MSMYRRPEVLAVVDAAMRRAKRHTRFRITPGQADHIRSRKVRRSDSSSFDAGFVAGLRAAGYRLGGRR